MQSKSQNGKTSHYKEATDKFMDAMKNHKSPNIDLEAAMNVYKKHMELLAEAHKSSFETFQSVTKLHAGFSRQVMDDLRDHYKDLSSAKSLEERAHLHSERMKDSLNKLLDHSHAVSGTWSKSCDHIGGKLKKHYQESVESTKEAVAKATSNAHSKKQH